MVYIKGNIEVKTTTRLLRLFLQAIETLHWVVNHFLLKNHVAHEDNCFIGLTGPPIGDVVRMSINASNGLIV